MSNKDWEKFRNEKIKQWLKPVSFTPETYEESDKRYTKFMEQKKLISEEKKKAGTSVKDWETKEDPERKVGWRGQKWFSEMLFDLQVVHETELKAITPFDDKWLEIKEKLFSLGFSLQDWITLKYALEINPDMNIRDFGTIELKTSLNIKKNAWDSNPSLFLVVLKVCDKGKALTFQFLGWLYGYEVYKLKVQEENMLYPKAHYFVEDIKKLRKPRSFLEMVLNVSRANPCLSK